MTAHWPQTLTPHTEATTSQPWPLALSVSGHGRFWRDRRWRVAFICLGLLTGDYSACSAETPVQKVYRPSDQRPQRDDAQAAELGVLKYSSERLILYTDLDPEIAKTLPPIIDQAYTAWVDYFGELPPNREGTPYQVTGYLIDDPAKFVAAGMLAEGPPMFRFGRHSGQEFWMNKMNSDYYRRHLLIHEATHCFMTTMLQHYPPRWYVEGMAEYFGTHTLGDGGRVTFGVMPAKSEDFPGLGRIELIQQELVQGRFANLSRLGAYTATEWDRPVPIPYAWGWAICQFLEQHPRYHDRFRELGQHLEARAFQRYMAEHFDSDLMLLSAEWEQYAQRLTYEYDFAANAFVSFDGELRELPASATVKVDASKGWQSAGYRVAAGDRLQIRGSGEVILDRTTQAWMSEPQGISIRYAAGEPIGKLLAAVLPESSGQGNTAPVFQVFPVGADGVVTSESGGELWLRVNDLGDSLSNNSGHFEAEISREPAAGKN